jgi:transcriptional regulator
MSATDDARGGPQGLVQGTLDMLILHIVAAGPLHGFGIANRIVQVSGGIFTVNPGSLLPALRRLERAGHVKGSWKTTEHNRRARYYALTRSGARRLEQAARDWRQQSDAIAAILRLARPVR